MMAAGLLSEVQRLHARGDLHPGLPAIRAVGYRQLWAHLEGEYGLDEAIRRSITATRRLAKRQMTWLRAEPALCWLADASQARAAVRNWLAATSSSVQDRV
jgi:tRNA dimethylallyltransferase